MKKFCAFGVGYLDRTGEIIEESENYYIVVSDNYSYFKLALTKDSRLTKVFDTKEERDEWIRNQGYQYDPR